MSQSEFRSPNQIVDDALRAELRALLERCTEQQQAFFFRIYPPSMYPSGIDSMPEDKLKTAIDQCQRTIRKNERASDAAR